MQTRLTDSIRHTSEGRVAESILRKCVHCGFCNATCPTYQLLGDENEGPRGRIYLIKQLMEGHLENTPDSGRKTLQHLDRCLLCRACETTCPSGVEYGKLLDIGRNLAEQHAGRERADNTLRKRLRNALSLLSRPICSSARCRPISSNLPYSTPDGQVVSQLRHNKQ